MSTVSTLGDRTNEILKWFTDRKWRVLNDTDAGSLSLEYTRSFMEKNTDADRCFGSGSTYLENMNCLLTLKDGVILASITTCGVSPGCPEHTTQDHDLGVEFDHNYFGQTLGHWESKAMRTDCETVAMCLTFGPCGNPSKGHDQHMDDVAID